MLSLLGKNWQSRCAFDPQKSFLENFFVARKKCESDFLLPQISDLADPFLFRDMEKAVEKIFEIIKNKQRILIFGDYDLDGMSAVAQVFQVLRNLGAQVSYRLPCRSDGYGLSQKFIREAQENDVKLLITTDCGISNFQEISNAKEAGIETIITDHHSIPEKIPPAYAFLHPLLPEETFPDKNLTGAGVAFFLCMALIQKKFALEGNQYILKQFLEHAVLGTIADCGELCGQNRVITMLGIEALKNTQNPGMQKLFEVSGIHPQDLTAEKIAFYVAPRLNAAGRLAHPKISLELLLGNKERATELEIFNSERRELVEKLIEQAHVILGEGIKKLPTILVKSPDFPSGVVGLVSGKLAEKYGVPVIALEQKDEKLTASCRGPDDFHFAKTLKEIAREENGMFLGFGGHAAAAGFSMLPGKFEEFQKVFLKKVIEQRGEEPPISTILFDFEVGERVASSEVELLQRCQPFGVGNVSPQFLFPQMEILKIRKVGKTENHLSLYLKSSRGQCFSGVFFGNAEFHTLLKDEHRIDVLATPEVREWNGEKSIQLQITDIRRVQ